MYPSFCAVGGGTEDLTVRTVAGRVQAKMVLLRVEEVVQTVPSSSRQSWLEPNISISSPCLKDK